MHLKRYLRQTVQEALRAVREDLGPDALVLSTRLVAAPGARGWLGRRVVDVTAAADRPDLPESRQVSPGPPTRDEADQRTREITARLEATGLDAQLAREVALAHPPGRRRGMTPLVVGTRMGPPVAVLGTKVASCA